VEVASVTALVVALAVAVGLLGLLVAGLLRSHAEILRRLHELGAGLDDEHQHGSAPVSLQGTRLSGRGDRPAFDLAGTTPDDEAVAYGVVGAGHPTLLAFLTSGCVTCEGFWGAFADPARRVLPGGTRLVVVTKGPEQESESRVRDLAGPGLPVVMSTEAWEQYDVPVAPYFVHVDGPAGEVRGEGAAQTWDQLVGLLERALADQAAADDGEARADRALESAGILPGDPRLYPTGDVGGTP
jgi:hypothetical protein